MSPNKPAKSRARPAGSGKPAVQAREGEVPASIRLDPELRIRSAASLYEAFAAAARSPAARIVVDGSGVEKADTAGVQALVAGRRRLLEAGKAVEWSGCSVQLRSAAELLGTARLLELPS